jgi:hypothetical protein
MEKTKPKEAKVRRRYFWGVFCFCVGVVIVLAALTYVPHFLFLFFCIEMGLVGFFLACFLFVSPVLALFSVAIWRKSGRVIAWIGLVLAILCTTVVLPVRLITYTPAGSVPNAFREYKFRKACPCGFWLDFDKKHMTDIQSQYTIILVRFGTVRFESDPNTYDRQKVIDYAELNGWIYKCSIFLSESNLRDYYSKELPFGSPIKWALGALKSYNYTELIWLEDCDVLLFDAKTQHGMPAYVLISGDGSKMEIRYANPRLPDPGHEFWIPDGFDELPGDCGNQDSVLPSSMNR